MPPLYKDQLPSLADLISINTTYLCVGTLVRSTSLRISCHQSAIGRLYTCGSVNLKVIQRSVNCHGRAGQLLLGVVHNNLPPIRCCTLPSSDPIPSNHLLPCFPPFSFSSHWLKPVHHPSRHRPNHHQVTDWLLEYVIHAPAPWGPRDFYPVIFLLFFIFS